MVDRRVENLKYAFMQPPGALVGDVPGKSARVNPRSKKRFIRIDVANPADE